MDAYHPYVLEKLREEEQQRIREVERTHWRKEQQSSERKYWRWGNAESGRRR